MSQALGPEVYVHHQIRTGRPNANCFEALSHKSFGAFGDFVYEFDALGFEFGRVERTGLLGVVFGGVNVLVPANTSVRRMGCAQRLVAN